MDMPPAVHVDTLSESSECEDEYSDKELPMATRPVKRPRLASLPAGAHPSSLASLGKAGSLVTSTVATSASAATSSDMPPPYTAPPSYYYTKQPGPGVWMVENDRAYALIMCEYPGQELKFQVMVHHQHCCLY